MNRQLIIMAITLFIFIVFIGSIYYAFFMEGDKSVILYGDNDFSGQEWKFTWPGKYDKGPIPSDIISSYKVGEGTTVNFYEHPGFSGRKMTVTGPQEGNLPEFNDNIDSIEIMV